MALAFLHHQNMMSAQQGKRFCSSSFPDRCHDPQEQKEISIGSETASLLSLGIDGDYLIGDNEQCLCDANLFGLLCGFCLDKKKEEQLRTIQGHWMEHETLDFSIVPTVIQKQIFDVSTFDHPSLEMQELSWDTLMRAINDNHVEDTLLCQVFPACFVQFLQAPGPPKRLATLPDLQACFLPIIRSSTNDNIVYRQSHQRGHKSGFKEAVASMAEMIKETRRENSRSDFGSPHTITYGGRWFLHIRVCGCNIESQIRLTCFDPETNTCRYHLHPGAAASMVSSIPTRQPCFSRKAKGRVVLFNVFCKPT